MKFLYRDRQNELQVVIPERRLPGRMWICRRTTDGAELFLHESLLQPLTEGEEIEQGSGGG